jgi:hypothetical protein
MSGQTAPKGKLCFVDTERFSKLVLQSLLNCTTHAGWLPWSCVDKEEVGNGGAARQILMGYVDKYGNPSFLVIHYAYGGGEEQPPFKGWFYKAPGGDGFYEVPSWIKPLVWCYLPDYSYLDKFGTPDENQKPLYRLERR